MKKITILSLLAAISFNAFAQVRVGVQAGASLNSPTIKGFGSKKTRNVTTVSPGIIVEIPLPNGLTITPSINYLKSAFTLSETYQVPASGSSPAYQTQETNDIASNNIQIPLDLNLPIKLKKGVLYVTAGPVLTIGLDAEVNYTETNLSTGVVLGSGTAPLTFGGGNATFKKFDWGSRIGLGYRFNKNFDLKAQYKYGFTDLSASSNETYKNHIVSLTASWFLIGNKK